MSVGSPRWLAHRICAVFDWIEARWERTATRQFLGTALVTLFLVTLGVIELKRRGWLPAEISGAVPSSHFGAVALVFTFLLIFEIASLIFALAHSVAESLGKQFELLALILMREAFLEFGSAAEPVSWNRLAVAVPHALADMAGALAVFVLLIFYYRAQRHRTITTREEDQATFVCAKKVVALALLGLFIQLALGTAGTIARGAASQFFQTFYTILILSDILIVLISLRFSSSFPIVFRNAGFAAATLVVRVALSAPPYVNAVLATAGVAFALALSLAYNSFRDNARGMREASHTPPS
jgi:hypothetical protein